MVTSVSRLSSGALVLLGSIVGAAPAEAQDYGAMLQQYLQQDQMLTQQMRQTENAIVQGNMQNPQVQQMYMNYRNNGGTMSFPEFAYQYAATAGFTPDGVARYRQNEQNIQQRDQQSLQQYRQAEAARGQAQQQMFDRYSQIARQRGNLLNGTTDYHDPGTGAQYNLPHTIPPNNYYYDQGTGQTFYNDPQGNYYRGAPNGDWNRLEEDD